MGVLAPPMQRLDSCRGRFSSIGDESEKSICRHRELGGVMFVSGFAPMKRAKAGLGHLAFRGGRSLILYERHWIGVA